MKIGLLSDIHGDLAGFKAALAIFSQHGITCMLCPGDIVERGSEADEIVRLIQKYGIMGVTSRDSHTCAILSLPEKEFQVFDLDSGKEIAIPVINRSRTE